MKAIHILQDTLAALIVVSLYTFIIASFFIGFADGLRTSDCRPKRLISYINIPWRLSCEMSMTRNYITGKK